MSDRKSEREGTFETASFKYLIMKYKFLTTLPIVATCSIIFHFIYLFMGNSSGGIAMAPFVFVPVVLGTVLLIILINLIFLFLHKNISPILNLFLFLIVLTFLAIYDNGFDFFSNLLSNNSQIGYTTRLMYLPIVFGTICTFFYEKRNWF